MSTELKCCKSCGAFVTCTSKGECCPECDLYDPIDNICMKIPERKREKKVISDEPKEIDPDTYLWDDDEDEENDLTDLPPERDSEDEDDFGFDDDDDDW